MLILMAAKLSQQSPTLLQRGHGLAFAGLLMGGVSAFITRGGRQGLREMPRGFSRGRYVGMLLFKVPLLIMGLTGLVLIAVALSR